MSERRGTVPDFRLDGQVALVIGGTSGIGKAIAMGYAGSGARVIVSGRNAAKMEAALAEIRAHGEGHGYAADVADPDELRGLVGIALAHHGRIDTLVNCQGMTTLKPAEEFTAADWDEIVGINLRSVFFACTEVGRHMLGRGRGAIVNIGSLASYRGWPRSAIYGITKAAVVNLTESLAIEWAGRGVRVNAILPAQVVNPGLEQRMNENPALRDKFLSGIPAGRLGQSDDIRGLAVFLASDASSWITGTLIPMDGGNLAANAGATMGRRG